MKASENERPVPSNRHASRFNDNRAMPLTCFSPSAYIGIAIHSKSRKGNTVLCNAAPTMKPSCSFQPVTGSQPNWVRVPSSNRVMAPSWRGSTALKRPRVRRVLLWGLLSSITPSWSMRYASYAGTSTSVCSPAATPGYHPTASHSPSSRCPCNDQGPSSSPLLRTVTAVVSPPLRTERMA